MTIAAFTLYPYRIAFRVPFNTSRGMQRHRRGVIVAIRLDDGTPGYGEAVALPSFGTANDDEIVHRLEEFTPSLRGESIGQARAILGQELSDSRESPVRFALDTALLDAESRRAGVSLARHLTPAPATSVPVNATISQSNAEAAEKAASYAVLAGYPAIKMKVGMTDDGEAEAERVRAVRREIGPDTELRLDVNGSWQLEQAVAVAGRLEEFDIAYLEQPLPQTELEATAELRRRISIPIAVDEDVTDRRAVEQVVSHGAADVIILKPAIVGGLTVARDLVALAEENDIRVVVTTALEAGVGITAALHLAATLKPPLPACGLATGALLEHDLLVQSPVFIDGRMQVPDGPGLGVELMESVLSVK